MGMNLASTTGTDMASARGASKASVMATGMVWARTPRQPWAWRWHPPRAQMQPPPLSHTWHRCRLPRLPPALVVGLCRRHNGPQTLKLNHLSTAEERDFNPDPSQSPGLSQGCRDAAGPVAEGLSPHSRYCPLAVAQAGSSGRRTGGLSRGGTLCAPTRAPSYHLALLGRGSGCSQGGGHQWPGGGRRGAGGDRGGRAACRAPVLLSDMILLMAIGNGFAALAGRIRSFLPAFLPPLHCAPHGWARRRDAGRHLASVFTGSASSRACASTALDGS